MGSRESPKTSDAEDALTPSSLQSQDLERTLADIAQRMVQRLGLTAEAADCLLLGKPAPDAKGDRRRLALVAFDADGIQSQVLASPRPVTIQGASHVLRSWDMRLQAGEDVPDAVVLFAGGGQAVLLSAEDAAHEIEKRVASLFLSRTNGWPCTTASMSFTMDALSRGPGLSGHLPPHLADKLPLAGVSFSEGGGFGACLASLHAVLRSHKLAAKPHPFVIEETRKARCEECGTRTRTPTEPRLCEQCARNRAEGAHQKKDSGQARTFDELFGGRGGIAFMAVDGKGIGSVLQELRTMAQYATVSHRLHKAFELTGEGSRALGLPDGRYQIPVAGGDDLLLVVPSAWTSTAETGLGTEHNALRLTESILQRIEGHFVEQDLAPVFDSKRDQGILKKVCGIGAGAGVVIASHMPARFCFKYARELMVSAKSAVTGAPGARSAVDFALLAAGSPLSTSISELRKGGAAVKRLGLGRRLRGDMHLTRKPYTLAALGRLLNTCERCRALPRSSIHSLRAAMLEPNSGLLTICYQLARTRGKEALRNVLLEPDAQLPPDPAGQGGLGEWIVTRRPGTNDWETGIPDLLEVLKIVGPETEGQSLRGNAAEGD